MKIVHTKENDTGILLTKEDDTTTRYEITTFAWKWRGWKIYFASKIVQILSGTAYLTLEIDGKDEEIILTPKDWDFHIPEWIPNIFYFPELTQMVETFPKGTKVEEFERYRVMKKL